MTISANNHSSEIARGHRFSFGSNWNKFLKRLDDGRIQQAEMDLRRFLDSARLDGKTFLDIGSGSGLSSLVAHRLGAHVHSFDYDPESVACTAELRRRYAPNDLKWDVASGSVLDNAYLLSLGQFDVVYSWGVLHHTGSMWKALDNAAGLVKPGGTLFVAIYNDQGRTSKVWLRIKKAYCALPAALRFLVVVPAMFRLWGPTVLRDTFRGQPLRSWHNYASTGFRGMDPWRDAIDWIGGLPFEVATPEAIFDFYRDRGFSLTRLSTCAGGIGCNQFVFQRE
jgi:2-polyprenyl-3-methyl-5-hydroxy-6-metoxy-1,4-benzoquinol methylase